MLTRKHLQTAANFPLSAYKKAIDVGSRDGVSCNLTISLLIGKELKCQCISLLNWNFQGGAKGFELCFAIEIIETIIQ